MTFVGSPEDSPRLTGWWNPSPFDSRSKFHYVGLDRRTLCGKWAFIGRGDIEDGQDEHPDNCATCRRKKLAQKRQP